MDNNNNFNPNENYQPIPQDVKPQGGYDLETEVPVTMGEWVISLLILCIPCVNIVMMFVWAFSKTEKKSKSNFFKAQLIFMGVIFVLYLFIIIVLGVGMIGMMGQ